MQSQQNSYDPGYKYFVVLNINMYQYFEGMYYLNLSIPKMKVYLSEKIVQQLQGYEEKKLKKTAICPISITHL